MCEHSRTQEAQGAIEAMRQLMEIQDTPMVGSFWYDAEGKELFGVSAELAVDKAFRESAGTGARVRTGSKSHEGIWQKERARGKDPRFQSEYASTLRGHVFELEGQGFRVRTGSWIEGLPEAKPLIIEEFELPEDETEFVQDSRLDAE